MNPQLLFAILALSAMTTSVRIINENEENYDDVERQSATSLVYSRLIISILKLHSWTSFSFDKWYKLKNRRNSLKLSILKLLARSMRSVNVFFFWCPRICQAQGTKSKIYLFQSMKIQLIFFPTSATVPSSQLTHFPPCS